MSRWRQFGGLAVVCAACPWAGCSGPVATSPVAERGIPADVTADEVAERLFARYNRAQSYADSASYVQHYVVRGEGVERERPFFELALALARPNRLRLTLKESISEGPDRQSYDVACDGRQLRVAVAALPDQILVAPAPAELAGDNFLPDPLLRDTLLAQSLANVFPQLAMMWNRSEDELVFPEDGAPRLLASKSLAGRVCYRLETTNPAGKRVLWIDQETDALLRMELPVDAQKGELDPDSQYMEHSVWIDFRDPAFDADIDDATFVLEAPAEATLVTALTPPVPPGPSPVTGRLAAEAAFYDPQRKKRVLEDYQDKIVVLDFWQVECPPCRRQAQLIDEVRTALGEDSGVEFLAVNVDREDAPRDLLDRTWKSWGGTFGWLADVDRQSRKTFAVEATPTLVVLDQKSRVQLWRPGPLESADELRQVLEDLRAGKDLAGEARAAHEARVAEHRRTVDSRKWTPPQ
ncbi:MAG: redoxin domain-containing protein [Pirellulales bacterium]|nr:redoxin domain-containing protein [Pirellulales bacterium]